MNLFDSEVSFACGSVNRSLTMNVQVIILNFKLKFATLNGRKISKLCQRLCLTASMHNTKCTIIWSYNNINRDFLTILIDFILIEDTVSPNSKN